MPEIYVIFVRKIFSRFFFGGGGQNVLPPKLTAFLRLCPPPSSPPFCPSSSPFFYDLSFLPILCPYLLSPPCCLSHFPFPFPFPYPLNTARALRSAVSYPIAIGSGQSPAAKRFRCIFRLKSAHLLSLATPEFIETLFLTYCTVLRDKAEQTHTCKN